MERHPDDDLTRQQTAADLTKAGFPTSAATLATYAWRGTGPVFRKYGRRTLYRWGDSLAWAQGRLSKPVRATSELKETDADLGSRS